MSAIKTKLPNLTDIPLGLEQGDGNSPDITADKVNKVKLNSLKRFFQTAKNSMTTSKSSDDATDAVCETDMKNVRSLQLRFGSFHKNDDKEKTKSNSEPSSSTEVLKPKPTESRLKLQSRISSYLSTAFKKPSKKSSTNDNTQLDDKITPPPSYDGVKFENNQPANL